MPDAANLASKSPVASGSAAVTTAAPEKSINCIINGQAVKVPEGLSVIEAYKKLNINIAHYCWHPGLSVAGVCRLCLVEVKGMPKLQIACNTKLQEGMEVSNQSEVVKRAVRWGLDFHLINHPLDCPICDQSGECGLQEQYMQHGAYDPEMAVSKVKKSKVVDLGSKIVLDSERCILCSRCVRFCDEVTKTNELGIFHRGDRSEIGTARGRPLENNYSVNTVDICPVGALTSKKFRFKQRVWYLKSAPSVCTGCSTGCNVTHYYNEEGVWRTKPRENPAINGHWMCDEGRGLFEAFNPKNRLKQCLHKPEGVRVPRVAFEPGADLLKQCFGADKNVALVLTPQHTNEEYADFLSFWQSATGFGAQVFVWNPTAEKAADFDGLLLRGDRNPNTKGLSAALKKHGIKERVWSRESAKDFSHVCVVGFENAEFFKGGMDFAADFADLKALMWFGVREEQVLWSLGAKVWQLPLKVSFEKSGTFVNFQGREQRVQGVTPLMPEAKSLSEWAKVLGGASNVVHAGAKEFAREFEKGGARAMKPQGAVAGGSGKEFQDPLATQELKTNHFVEEDFYGHP